MVYILVGFYYIYFLLCQEVKRFYSEEGAETGPYLEVDFEEEVSLDIPEDGVILESGWSVLPLTYPARVRDLHFIHKYSLSTFPFSLMCSFPLQLLCESVDSYKSGRTIPSCQIELDWVKKDKPLEKLDYKLYLVGVNQPRSYLRIIRNPNILGQGKENNCRI